MIAPASAILAYKAQQEAKGMGEGTSKTPPTTPISTATATAQTRVPSSPPSLPWPSHQPAANIPFFDSEMYKTVDLNVKASSQSNGLDLPLNDITTLRFFFNLGVQQSRAVLQSQLEEQLRNGTFQSGLLQVPLSTTAPSATSTNNNSTSFATFCPPSLSNTGLW